MSILGNFRSLTPVQRNTFIACFLGWSLDAFDYFILIFCASAIAAHFQLKISTVLEANFITLAMRPVGAFLFGLLADRFGRRPTLMLDIVAYSIFELATAFAPSWKMFFIMRAFFGIAMGGEWGVGAALAFETLPAEGRGFFSGLLQEGYVVGNLLAALAFGTLFPHIGWRGMFVVGALPAFLILYIRTKVEESPAWRAGRVTTDPERNLGKDIMTYLGSFLFLALLMFAFNSFSHGTQDVYPTFLTKNHGFSPQLVSRVAIFTNIGALLGGVFFGAFSEQIGRRKAIVVASLSGDPGDSAVGFLAHGRHAGDRGLRDAVHGAGRLGSDSRASQRAFAAGRSRHIPRIRLSARQSAFVEKFCDSSSNCGAALRRKFCARSGVDGLDRCDPGRDRHGKRKRSKRRRPFAHETRSPASVAICAAPSCFLPPVSITRQTEALRLRLVP